MSEDPRKLSSYQPGSPGEKKVEKFQKTLNTPTDSTTLETFGSMMQNKKRSFWVSPQNISELSTDGFVLVHDETQKTPS
jgi:hypothetical protein